MKRIFVLRSEKQIAKCPIFHVFKCVHVVLVCSFYSFCNYFFEMISQFLILYIYTGCKQVLETVLKNISLLVICHFFSGVSLASCYSFTLSDVSNLVFLLKFQKRA